MSKQNDLWTTVLKEGVGIFNERSGQANYSSLVLIGPPNSGKSTLIHAFLDKDDEPKPSLPVEYTYARRTNKHMVKDVCYIWEVETTNISFVLELIKEEGLEKVSILLVTDLSRSDEVWNVCKCLAEFNELLKKETQVQTSLGITGMKYDLFENLETQKKATICRILKHYATILEGHLIFCSKFDRTTIKVAKDLFSHLAFMTKFSHQQRFDLNSAVIIPRGIDNRSDLDYLHQTFDTQCSQTLGGENLKREDPAEDVNYMNEKVDARRKMT